MAVPERLTEIQGLPGFWERVRLSRSSLLLLDYDGTLAPFHPDRMQARPYPGVEDALDKLIALDGTTTVIVSGRPVGEILELAGLDNIMIAGTHGFELFRPGIGTTQMLPDDGSARRLDMIEGLATEIVGPELAERKIATVALHTRKLSSQAANRAQTRFRQRVVPLIHDGFEVRDFNGGVEVRLNSRDKGVAVREIIDELPASDLIVYIGDDDTDEDAFRALPERGIGIRVDAHHTPSAATGRLRDCDDVLRFLTNWIAIKTCQ